MNEVAPSPASTDRATETSKYGSSEKSFELTSKLYDLQDEFDEAIRITKKLFKSSDLPEIIDYLITHTMSLLGPNKKKQAIVEDIAQAVREEFECIETIPNLFTVLQSKYISWFNYRLIIKLIGVFLPKNRSLKRTWLSYEEKLKDYFINSGGLLKDADAVQFGVKGVPPGTRVMIAKVDRDDYTLDDLFFFHRAIPKGLDIPEYDLYFSFVHNGSLCLGYLIPEYLYSFLFPLTTKLQQQLASIGITELTCGEDKYDLTEFSIEDVKHSSTDIDICDPLWYENTSTPLHEAAWRGLEDEVQWLLVNFGYSTYHRGLHGWTPLHSASYGGHIEIVQLLIHQYGIDPNEGDDNSVSSIHMASYKGYLSIVQYLVDTCHVPPDQPDSSNNTALLYSAMGGHSDLVKFFIERNCNSFQINCYSESLSLLACQSGELALIHKLELLNLFSPDDITKSGAGILHYTCRSMNNKSVELFKYLLNQYQLSIDVKDQYGRTLLHIASWFASSSVVEYIVSIQGNKALFESDNNGMSCLHYACHSGIHIPAGIVYSKLMAQRDASVIGKINNTTIKTNINFIKRNERVKMFSSLLKKANTCPNFSINVTTNDGLSLLHFASWSGTTLLKALEEYNINCSLTNDDKHPVHYAALSGSTSVLRYIISQYNLNANDTDTYGRTPLVYSCWSGSINSVKYLINNHNSDSNVTDKYGMTCLNHSCCNGHIDITQYLIDVQHCDINETDNEGCMLVHHAAWSGNFDLVKYLITEQGLSPNAVTKNGLTALHYASWSLNLSLVKELITTYQLDPHQSDSNDKLPIHYAAESGDILLLELYVKKYKCSLSLTDSKGWNVFHFSSLKGHTHFIKHITSQYPQYISLLHSTDNEGWVPLHLACESGNIQLVTFLINDMKCDVNAKDTHNQTCVTFACFSGNLDVVQLLTQQCKLEPINIDKYSTTALHAAAETGHTHILEWYSQEYSVDITNHTSNNKYTLAHSAAYNGNLHCLQELINKYQCDVNATTTTGSTVLHKACEGGHVPVVLYLTSLHQCNVAAKTSNGSTVLHITCQYSGSLPILKHLVENHQLDLFADNDDGMAPIHLACSNGRLNLIQYIIEHIPSSLELPDSKDGRTPFLIAVYFNQLEVIKYLNSKKCNLSATDGKGSGAVHISVERGHLNVLKYLIDNNYCNPNTISHQDCTPLHVAVAANKDEILQYLLSKSIPSMSIVWLREIKCLLDSPHDIYNNPHNAVLINVQDKDGNTPLHVACQHGRQNMVLLLLKASLSNNDLLITNKKGQTPLHLAAASGHKDTAEALLFSVTGSSTHHNLLTATDNEGSTVFHTACSHGHIDVFLYLYSIHPDGINTLDNRKCTILHAAYIEDFYDIYEKMEQLSPRWKQIAISLRLKISTINRIEADCRGDTVTCLQKVLEYWLIKDYDYERYGIPCWRRVCVAVKEGGRNSALADEIAREHPLPAMPPAGSTSSKEKSATPESDEVALSPASTDRATVYVHRPEINHPLAKKIYELQDVFADALQISMESFLKKPGLLHKILNYLTMHVHALLGPIRKNNPSTVQAVREEFSDIKTMTDLFIILQDKYVSWFNYELIIKLVRVFLSDNRTLKRAWSSYEEKLKDYFINSGGLLKDADAVEFGVKGVPPGTRVMIAKVDRDDYTLDDLFFFRSAIPEECDVPHYNIYFLRVRPGSVVLEYLISEYLYSLLFPLTTKLQQQLASIGITELTCGDSEDKYDLREFSIEEVKLSSTDIDICDPLWYENTSTPLHEAAWRGLRDEVQWLLDKFGYSTYHRGLHGWTPLHSASYGGHIEILQLLIHQYGIDPNEDDDNSVSSIHMASYKGHLSIVQYLVDTCHVPPDQPDNSNSTALLYSAMGGHSDLVEFFNERNCNTSQINFDSESLSLLACKSGELALVYKLGSLNLFSPDDKKNSGSGILQHTCYSINNKSVELFKYFLNQYQLSIDLKDQYGKTLLHFASWYGSSSVVEYIVSTQGNEALLVNDNNGWSCLHHACDAGMHNPAGIVYSKLMAQSDASSIGIINNTRIKQNIDFIKRNETVKMFSSLLKKARTCPNFNINATTNDGCSLLHLASLSGSTLLVKALEEYNINCTLTNDGRSPVHYAAWSGSTSVLSYIISQYNLNANDTDTYGCTPLVYSCRSGSINSVKYLINNHNSDPNITDKYGMTCLHHCCRLGHIEITQCLIEVQHCDINKTDNEGRTLVHHAAQSGNFDLVQYLITEQGLSPTAATKNGITALHYASVSLNLSLVKELITTYQLDPHQADSKGKLPIHYAAESGDILLLELYVKDYKCSLSLTDNEGWNVIHYSSLKGHTHFVKHITSQYPQYISLIHSTDNDGRIPLHLACNSGNIQSVTFLINDMECDVTAKETSDETCVTFACFSGNLDLVQLLIQQYKLEPLATKKSGVTALHAAAGCGHTHILEWYSQEYSVDIPNHTSNNKYTLAHLAAYEGKLHCLQELINKYQCDVNATTTTGRTVLHKACEGGHVPVVLYLTSLPQCDVAANTSNGLTALHITCGYSDSLPILKHLVENHQLDLCAVNDEGMAPIHLACLKGRQELVQYIIEHIPSSLDLPVTGYGHTPFLTAVCFNQLDVIKYLISKKCNLSATDDEGYGAVHISVEEGHLNVLKYLIDNNYCNPNATDRQDRTPLHVAVAADKFELLEYLIKSSLLNNVQDKDGDTPLHFACRRGKQKMVSLLTSSANINILITNKKGQTPLHLAVASGHKDTAEALLFSVTGSSTHHDLLTATDNEGSTVFHTACSNGHIDVFCYLCHVYPEGVKSLDANKRSLLHISCERNWMDMVKELVEKYGLLPESQDKDGITCLHLLAKEGNIKIFQYLRHHIHSNAVPRDKSGRIPLHYACLFNRNEMALYLIKSCHYNPDDPDNNGYTSVHGACEAGNFELVLYFITECGCNAQAKTKDQKTLLYYAIKSSNLEMVRFLTDVMDLNPTSIDFEAAESNSAILKHLEETRKNVKNLVEVETRDDTNNLGHFIKNMPMMIDPSRQYYIS
uniref:Uncharacterized protein n=1 Tax=Amphimedon queenslandica TaxID=400682 RepID=A0A1X7TR60_AMPQE